jgi:predicted phage tail protein
MISGGGGGKSGGSGGGLSEQEDTLKSQSYAQVLDLVAEGEIVGLVDGLKSIYLDEVPIQNPDGSNNFTGVEYVSVNGTQTQSTIAGYDQVTNEVVVSLEAKISTGPVVRSITNTNVSSVIVTVQLPSLSFMDDTGNLGGSSVQFAIDLQVDGGGFVEKFNETITGKASSAYERQYRVNMPSGTTRQVRLRRITADSTSSQLNNKTFFKSYTEVIDAKLRYPNSALVALKIDASQFRSIPRRGYDVKLLKIKIPTNATVRTDGSLTYSGLWDGTFKTEWCANPAWCFYDLLTTDRYGTGTYIDATQVDKWALYTIGTYCDELVSNGFGGTEPRFTCNLYISNRQQAYKLLSDFTSIFRGMAFWGTGSVFAVQDAPKDPIYLFTNANVVDGVFSYSGSSAKARHTVALVSWNDPADMYRQKVEYVEDSAGIARYGIIETEVMAFGCSSRGQAHRVGRWLLFTERYETEVVGFKTGIEGSICRPGDIVKIADQHRAGTRLGGRIRSATSTTIVVDSLAAGALSSGTVWVLDAAGNVQQRTISSVSGTTITVTAAFSPVPVAQSAWLASSPTVEAQTFRVLSVVENETGEHEISAVEHDADKYAAIESGITLQQRTFSNLSPIPDVVSSVSMSESLYKHQSDVRAKITVTWPAAANATRYRVEWRLAENNFTTAETSATDFEILNTTVGKYEVRIFSIGALGTPSSAYANTTLNTVGKTAPPADVTGFIATVDPLLGVILNWTNVADIDLDQYQIRVGASWDAGTILTKIKATTFKVGTISGTSQTFWIKAIDTTGNYSTNATSASTTISVPTAVSITAQVVDNNVLLRWTSSTSTLAIDYYEVRRGSTWAGGTVVGRVSNATFVTLFETASGAYTYWIAGIDIGGNVGAQASVVASVNQPPDYQLFLSVNSTFGGTKTNAVAANGFLYMAVDTTETVQTHFTSRSWSTPQDQITAGYPYFIQPTGTSAVYEEVIDYGSTLPSAKVTLTGTWSQGFGASTVVPKISVSNTSSTGPWTDFTGVTEVFATTFRYIKIRYDVTASGGDDIITFSTINVRLDVKQKDDFGVVSAVSTDAGGTTVTFTQSFTDVASIILTPLGTTARYAIYDFTDVPNPTTFKVLLFDSSGTRISGSVSWAARGY